MGIQFYIDNRVANFDVEGPFTARGGWVDIGNASWSDVAALLDLDPQHGRIMAGHLAERVARAYASPALALVDSPVVGFLEGNAVVCDRPAGRISHWLRELDVLALEAGEGGTIRWA